ncbi:uncharacterized protein [Gossypium hirsutum]|uniref:Integrase zinc-binding domain-containing protein n=1 Tax=Gossypium hirsutum TaxID=3635 RepID=A0A1U8HN34_GOSHI|nr:uncharacterized protein LOC107887715 [Gossypium hirsutum]
MCIPNDSEPRQSILREARGSPYAMHPGGNKLYRDLREMYWLEVTDYVSKCLTCQQMDGQSKRVIQILEDMLRSCVLDFRGSWEDYLSLAEFTYNNSYQSKSKVKLIREWLKEAFDRQKSYADLKRKGIEYSVGDYVFLKVSPWKKIMRFGRKGKLELTLELEKIHDMFHVSMLRRHCSDPRT